MKPLKLLNRCKVEDDVRDAYARFFDIPFDASEYIDLYTLQVLFEFKYDRNLKRIHEKARVLAQSLYYVHRLRYGDIDELKANGGTLPCSAPTKWLILSKACAPCRLRFALPMSTRPSSRRLTTGKNT